MEAQTLIRKNVVTNCDNFKEGCPRAARFVFEDFRGRPVAKLCGKCANELDRDPDVEIVLLEEKRRKSPAAGRRRIAGASRTYPEKA